MYNDLPKMKKNWNKVLKYRLRALPTEDEITTIDWYVKEMVWISNPIHNKFFNDNIHQKIVDMWNCTKIMVVSWDSPNHMNKEWKQFIKLIHDNDKIIKKVIQHWTKSIPKHIVGFPKIPSYMW